LKILIENNIDSVSSKSLTSFMGSSEIHGSNNMMDDYPTVQFVGGFTESIEVNTTTKRKKISNLLEINGYGSMNGIYVGNFSGDELSYYVYEWVSSTIGPSYGTWNCINPIDPNNNSVHLPSNIPVNVYDSFGHFVRGRPTTYADYLNTLKNLEMTKEYLSTNFKIEATISSNVNLLTNIDEDGNVIRNDWGHVNFKIDSISKYSFDNTSHYEDQSLRKFWKVKGHFITENAGNTIQINDDFFEKELEVGMTLMFETDNADGTTVSRLAQILQIRGSGSKEKSITLIMRSFETTGVEDDLETIIDPSGITAVLNDFYDQTTDIRITYIFNSMRIGLLRAGYIEEFPNPQTGMTRSYRDYSKKTETLDGGHHAVNRNIAKIYNGKIILDRDRVRRFLSFSESQRAKPFPVEVLSNMEKETPTVFYGFFASTPTESFSFRTGEMRDIDFQIQQVF
jgi:hypothetical protein